MVNAEKYRDLIIEIFKTEGNYEYMSLNECRLLLLDKIKQHLLYGGENNELHS